MIPYPYPYSIKLFEIRELAINIKMGREGIEPPTQCASGICSPTELPPHKKCKCNWLLNVFRKS